MNTVINFKSIKWCFNNNNKRLSCMVYLVIHKAFIIIIIIIIIKTPFCPFKLYICNTLLLTCLHFVKHFCFFSLSIIFLIFF